MVCLTENNQPILSKEPSDPALESLVATKNVRRSKSKKSRRGERRVTFGHSDIMYIVPVQNLAPMTDIWYTSDDRAEMHKVYIADSRKMAIDNKRSDSTILRAFEECAKGESNLCPELASELHLYLQDETHTGLERMAARKIFNDRKIKRQTLYETVFGIQERHAKNELRRLNGLRFASEAISFSSVLFAHQMALAAAED